MPTDSPSSPSPKPEREKLIAEMVARLSEYLATLTPEEAERRMRLAEIAAGLRGKETW